MKVEWAIPLLPTRRQRWAFGAKWATVRRTVVKMFGTIREATAAQQREVGIFGISALDGDVDPFGDKTVTPEQVHNGGIVERTDSLAVGRSIVWKDTLSPLKRIAIIGCIEMDGIAKRSGEFIAH